jgi:hypothetical protein
VSTLRPPDIDRLIAEIATRHGVLLKRDDAAFALVTLNQLMLEQALAEVDASVRRAVADLDSGSARLHSRVGRAIGQEIRQTILSVRDDLLASDSRNASGVQRAGIGRLVPAGIAILAAGIVIGMLLK